MGVDVEAMLDSARHHRHAVVIGGGLLGLERELPHDRLGLADEADKSLFELDDLAKEGICLVMGAEGNGLSRLVRERCEEHALAEVSDAGGNFKVLNPPFRLSNADTGAGHHSPALGEHTVEVLRGAGLSMAEIAACAAGMSVTEMVGKPVPVMTVLPKEPVMAALEVQSCRAVSTGSRPAA